MRAVSFVQWSLAVAAEIAVFDERKKMDAFLEVPNGQCNEDGTYPGIWTGELVTFKTSHGTFRGKASVRIRAMNEPCTVELKNGHYRVTADGQELLG